MSVLVRASATIIMGYQVCSSQWTVCNLTNNPEGTAYFGLFWTQICTTGCYKTTDSGSIVELCTDDRTYCTNYQNFVVLIPMAIAAFLGFMMSTILLTKLCGLAATKDVRICGGVSVTCLVLSLIIYPAMSHLKPGSEFVDTCELGIGFWLTFGSIAAIGLAAFLDALFKRRALKQQKPTMMTRQQFQVLQDLKRPAPTLPSRTLSSAPYPSLKALSHSDSVWIPPPPTRYKSTDEPIGRDGESNN
eukprot:193590_1